MEANLMLCGKAAGRTAIGPIFVAVAVLIGFLLTANGPQSVVRAQISGAQPHAPLEFSLSPSTALVTGASPNIAGNAPSGAPTQTKAGAAAQQSVAVDIPLLAGFNLFGLPVDPVPPLTASQVAQQIAAQGGQIAVVIGWNTGSQVFVPWHPASPQVNDFEIKAGQGYFLQVVAPPTTGAWSVTGLPFTQSVPLDLIRGFNLVSVPFMTPPGGYNTQSFAQAVVNAGGEVVSVQAWDASIQAFLNWLSIVPFANVFTLDTVSGYFVRVSQPTTSPFLP